jgi:hypothetical protein
MRDLQIVTGVQQVKALEELLKIADRLSKGEINEKEARKLLRFLLTVSESELNEHKLTVEEHGYGMYHLRQDGVFIMEATEGDCHERAMEIIEEEKNK